MSSNPAPWLLLIHRIPSKPDYLRVRIGRRLRQLGAVGIKSSVYAVPASPENRVGMSAIARDILQQGGEAVVCEARLIEGLADGAIEDLLRGARDAEYAAITRRAKQLAAELRGNRAANETRRRRVARALERLRSRFDQTVARDTFGARGRAGAANVLSLAEDHVQGVDEAGKRGAEPPEPPKGATWVTRTGVMVDRIASVWLIRRFLDPAARFRFETGRGHRPRDGEIRFDMAGAEYTHRDGLCTFEVLAESFGLRDSALVPIGEIVHDLDLEDDRHGRPETAGVGRMVVGLAIASRDDETRLAQGATIFENLYESFRRRGR